MAKTPSSEIGFETDAADWTMVDYGPMRLRIRATKNGEPAADIVQDAARASLGYLDRVASHRLLLSRPIGRITAVPDADAIVLQMIRSVSAIGDADLTPMAAVAGTLADAVADRLFSRGMTRVIVDNGGDIAIRLGKQESITVGIRSDIRRQTLSHTLRLDGAEACCWGVATSGFGGRSYTRGIASAVSVVGKNTAIADAAATAIANACFVEDKRILQMPADALDPNTDLVGVPVTVKIGPLPPECFELAIRNAFEKAEKLSIQGVIVGALIAAGGLFVVTDRMASLIVRPDG